jgi:hypothetical protein
MHEEARAYVEGRRTDERLSVLDIGGRNINGSVRDLFPNADPYVSLDIAEGPAVDIVADAAEWTPDRAYDLIVCTEVFEHTPQWPAILRTAAAACVPGGRLILTMAGPGRSPHGASGGPWDPPEHYENVDPDVLHAELVASGWTDVDVDFLPSPGDTRATAIRGL